MLILKLGIPWICSYSWRRSGKRSPSRRRTGRRSALSLSPQLFLQLPPAATNAGCLRQREGDLTFLPRTPAVPVPRRALSLSPGRRRPEVRGCRRFSPAGRYSNAARRRYRRFAFFTAPATPAGDPRSVPHRHRDNVFHPRSRVRPKWPRPIFRQCALSEFRSWNPNVI